MVTMKMGYENGLNLCEAYARSTKLYLRPLAAINPEKLSTNLHDLRRDKMLQCGQRAPTTQDMNIEWFQCYDNTKYIRENCLLNPFINKDSYLIFQIKGIATEVVNIKRVTI